MQAKNKTPLVSVIVPTFDSENFLQRCLDSLINQTLDNIEILVIDNQSTDSTLKIANTYAHMYPGKVYVHITPEHGSQALGRNLGIKLARGKYIAWCDSDDYMEHQGVELMYNKAIQGDYDIVFCDFYRHQNGYRELRRPSKEVIAGATTSNIIQSGMFALWTKLIKTQIYKEAGEMPVDVVHVDVTYVPILLQHCKKASYLASPVYNWIIRDGSVTRDAAAMEKTHVKTYDYLLKNTQPAFLDDIIINIARMARTYYERFYIYGDIQIAYYLEFRERYIVNNSNVLQNPDVVKMEELISVCATEPMNNIVYINGFNDADVLEKALKYKETAFNEGCTVVVLNEKICCIEENPIVERAFHSKNYDFVAEYFAIKNIYENGGVYLGDCIKLNAPLNYVRYNTSFFSYLDDKTFSHSIFGGTAKNDIFKSIFETYSNSVYGTEDTADRIKNILVNLYDVTIGNIVPIRKSQVWIYPPEMFVLCNHQTYYKNIAEHDFSEKVGDEQYVVVKRSTLASIGVPKIRNLINTADKHKKKYNSVRDKYTSLSQKYTSLSQTYKCISSKHSSVLNNCKALTLKVQQLENSYSHKIVKFILFPLRISKKMMKRIKKK